MVFVLSRNIGIDVYMSNYILYKINLRKSDLGSNINICHPQNVGCILKD